MGCAGSTYGPCGPTPANAVDISADRPGKDPTHSHFDTMAKAAFMPDRLRGLIPEREYEEGYGCWCGAADLGMPKQGGYSAMIVIPVGNRVG